jgi:hypothetical protein
LLPGPVNVFLDNSFVSKTSVEDINPNDFFSCILGTDPSVLVKYSKKAKTERSSSGAFAEPTKTTTYTTTVMVHNRHGFALSSLVIRGTIPLSGDNRVRVILTKPDGLASANDKAVEVKGVEDIKIRWADNGAGEKEGRFEWFGGVKAGGKVDAAAEWEVRGPEYVSWTEQRSTWH